MTVTERPAGLTRQSVEDLSASKGEPDWMLQRRLAAWEQFEALPLPTRQDEEWRRTDISKLKLAELVPNLPASGREVDSPLQLNGNNGGLLRHENAQTVDRSLGQAAIDQGVIFTDLETAVREHAELVQQYFMTEAVPPGKDKFSALNGALWSGGTFLYVPRGVTVDVPLRTLYTLTAPGAALFTHTMVVLEDGARATFIEEYASDRIEGQALNDLWKRHR